MNQETLDRLLTSTAAAVAYPATPELAGRVVAGIDAPAGPPSARRLAPAYVLAALLLALAVALALNPSRDAIARLFGVRGLEVEVVPVLVLPTATPTAAATAPAPPYASGLLDGRPVSLADLPLEAGFEAALPKVDEELRSWNLLFYDEQAVLVLRYQRFHLWQTRLRVDAAFGKMVGEDSVQEEVEVNGWDGLWLSGGSHIVRYQDERGRVIANSVRTVHDSTLIWSTDAFFYRIETRLPLEEALRIAATLP